MPLQIKDNLGKGLDKVNRSLLVGHITADPELRTTPNGIATTRITVAVNRMPNANGERIADFINVVVWRKQAENVVKYCKKGSHIGVEGRLQSRSYDAQDGTRKYVTEVVADNVVFLGSKSSSTQQSTQATTTQLVTQATSMQPVTNQSQAQMQAEEDPFGDFAGEVVINEDDLPF